MLTRPSLLKFAIATGTLLSVASSARPAAALQSELTQNSVLVLGGAGKIGRAVVEDFAKQGNKVTVVGSRDLEKIDDVSVKELLKLKNVEYVKLNLDATDDKSKDKLKTLLKSHDVTVDAAETYPIDKAEVASGVARTERIYKAAVKSGYTVQGGKVWVRIGSPPAEIASREAVPNASAKFEEDIEPTLSSDITNNLDHPYFDSKLKTARYAKKLASKDLPAAERFNVRTAAPTYFVGQGSWGPDREIVVKYHDTIRRDGVDQSAREGATTFDALVSVWWGAPNFSKRLDQSKNFHHYADNVKVDTVDAKSVARGIRLVTYFGDAGETYQLAGREASTSALLKTGLRAANIPEHELPQTVNPIWYEQAGARLVEAQAAEALGIPRALASLAFRLPRAMRAQRSSAKMELLNAKAEAAGYKSDEWRYTAPSEATLHETARSQVSDLLASKKLNPNIQRRPKSPMGSTQTGYGRNSYGTRQPATVGQAYVQAATNMTSAYMRGVARLWGVR